MIIILDRDGVINYDSKDYIKSPDEWQILPGSAQAIANLSNAGHTLIIATNQSGVGRGYFTLETLNQIHEKMIKTINNAGGKIKGIYFCPHRPDEQCICRKPRPGMLEQIKKDHPTETEFLFIGDSGRDIEAGLTAGCRVALVLTGNGKKTLLTMREVRSPLLPTLTVYIDLLDASCKLLNGLTT